VHYLIGGGSLAARTCRAGAMVKRRAAAALPAESAAAAATLHSQQWVILQPSSPGAIALPLCLRRERSRLICYGKWPGDADPR